MWRVKEESKAKKRGERRGCMFKQKGLDDRHVATRGCHFCLLIIIRRPLKADQDILDTIILSREFSSEVAVYDWLQL